MLVGQINLSIKNNKMKGLKIIIVFVGIAFFGIQNTYAQQKKIVPVEINEANLKSVAAAQLPAAVKKAATAYAGYKLKKSFVSQQKNNTKIYKIVITRGPIEYNLLIDEKGKVLEMTE